MNLTELSMSRAGRSSTRTEVACLGSILKITPRGPQSGETAPKNHSWTVLLTSDALSDRRWTVLLTSDALSDRRWRVPLTADALSDRRWTVPLTSDALSDCRWTVRLTPDASRNPFFTPVLNGDAPLDGFSWHPSNTNPMLNENCLLGLWNPMG